ncbi:MAG: hypothetical protein Dasosvirus3_5 [Dasosvirus sp.]|uniref:RING-type domain-containing protein n=1 Tax=Dasosvirus sp. TaxID=2487764 RepID=A0A3G4ZRB1_9VIRU|nr:MAG: hypothetical protein Dasosvirus3_5 [Dasosvirus sp.]
MEEKLVTILESTGYSYTKTNDSEILEFVNKLFFCSDQINTSILELHDPVKCFYVGLFNQIHNDTKNIEKYYLKAIESSNSDAMYNLSCYYDQLNDAKNMFKYLEMSANRDNIYALNDLAFYYQEKKHYNLAEKYYLKAIDFGFCTAMFNLANMYRSQGGKRRKNINLGEKIDCMLKYYLMAIDKGHVGAMVCLANYHEEKKSYEMMEKYYLMAIESKNSKQDSEHRINAMNYLGDHYYKMKEFDEMIQYYSMAIDEKSFISVPKMVYYYEKQKDFDNMLKYCLLSSNDIEARIIMELLDYCLTQNQMENSMKCYMILRTKGDRGNAIQHVIEYYKAKNEYADFIKFCEIAIEAGDYRALFALIGYYAVAQKDFDSTVKYYLHGIQWKHQQQYEIDKKLVVDNLDPWKNEETNMIEGTEVPLSFLVNYRCIKGLIAYYKENKQEEKLLDYYVTHIENKWANTTMVQNDMGNMLMFSKNINYYLRCRKVLGKRERRTFNRYLEIHDIVCELMKNGTLERKLIQCCICYENILEACYTCLCKTEKICSHCYAKIDKCPICDFLL